MYLDFNLESIKANASDRGFSGNIHFHIVPRLQDDTNFMSIVGQDNVIMNDLHNSYNNLKPYCDRLK